MSAETSTTDDQESGPEDHTMQLMDGTTATFGPPGSPICMQYPSLPGPWQYHVDVVPLGGVLGIAHLCIKQKPFTPSGLETPVTSRSLRTVPIQRFIQGARQAHQRQLQQDAGQTELVSPPTGSKSWPDEHFMQVAHAYWQAEAEGRPPRQAISERWNVSKVTASRWLKRARELGYLDPHQARQPQRLDPDPQADHEHSARRLEAEIFRKVLSDLATTAESPLREKAQALIDAIHEAHGEQPPPLPPHIRGIRQGEDDEIMSDETPRGEHEKTPPDEDLLAAGEERGATPPSNAEGAADEDLLAAGEERSATPPSNAKGAAPSPVRQTSADASSEQYAQTGSDTHLTGGPGSSGPVSRL